MASGCEMFLMKNFFYPLESCVIAFLRNRCKASAAIFYYAQRQNEIGYRKKVLISHQRWIMNTWVALRISYVHCTTLLRIRSGWIMTSWFYNYRMSRLKMRVQLLRSMDHLLRFRKSSWWKRKKMKKLPAKQNSKKPS